MSAEPGSQFGDHSLGPAVSGVDRMVFPAVWETDKIGETGSWRW